MDRVGPAASFVLLAAVLACDDGTSPEQPPDGWSTTGFAVTDVGALADMWRVEAVSDSGHVLGRGRSHEGLIAWRAGFDRVDLGSVDPSVAWAPDVNDRGQVFGTARLPGDSTRISVWTRQGSVESVATVAGLVDLRGLNDLGAVVGSVLLSGTPRAFLWTAGGGMVHLGTLGGSSSTAEAVSDSGQVVGQSETSAGTRHAFIWTASDGMVDIGTLPGDDYAEALAVNNLGQVVGWSGPGTRAFVWSEQTGMVDLGTFGEWYSWAYEINDRGEVVGSAASPIPKAPSTGFAFLWTASGGVTDLGTLGGATAAASDINERGVVAGSSDAFDGSSHGVLWGAR